jgi:hypothetical protein
MKTILVSLVSEQTIPNVLAAVHFKPDIHWFISTKQMEKEWQFIIDTVNLISGKSFISSENSKTIEVDPNSIEVCLEDIENLADSVDFEDVNFIVNITCGTKPMAIATFQVFSSIGKNVKIVYIPIGKTEFVQFFPKKKPIIVYETKKRLNVEEYISCYGYSIKNKSSINEKESIALQRASISNWMFENFKELKGMLGFFYKNLKDERDEKHFVFSQEFNRNPSQKENEFLRKFNFDVNYRTISKNLVKHEIQFLTGGWFEEYIFNEVNNLKEKLSIDDIKPGIELSSFYSVPNELDISFTKGNMFYHIECKTFIENSEHEKEQKSIINEEIYKKGALSSLLGKGGKGAFICTTLVEIKNHIIGRAGEYNIEILNIKRVGELDKVLLEKLK